VSEPYAASLDEFVTRCNELVDAGLAYLAVVLCHELFRFLYPVEPYADVVHDDPVTFAEAHITRLLRGANAYADAVSPYRGSVEQSRPAGPLAADTADLYSSLWAELDEQALRIESTALLEARLPAELVQESVVGARVVDIGCGSGRYSLALALAGAEDVCAVDYAKKAYAAADRIAQDRGLPVRFEEADVLALPFDDGEFDFVFCNGVLHHTASIERGLSELVRVLRPGGRAFLYLYGAGGIFWETRQALRPIFERIPLEYTKAVLSIIGMPAHRFIFCDTWYVPVETQTSTEELHEMLDRLGVGYEKIVGRSQFDLDGAIARGVRGARAMWGDGEHRYLLAKP
jgi:ubiquinone/menaquinone biosynthesis C-methylase UbiE